MIRAVLFDMDGTLLDTEKIYYRCWRRAAKECGHGEFIDEDLLAFSGMNIAGIQEYYRVRYNGTFDPTPMRNLRRQYVKEALAREGISAMKDAKQTLMRLREMGILCAVATSTARVQATDCLARAGLLELVDGLQAGDEVTHGKPHPEIFLKTAELLGVPITECVVVEDSHNGVRAGHSSGARTVMIPDMQPCTEEISALLWKRLDTLSQLPEEIRAENEIFGK